MLQQRIKKRVDRRKQVKRPLFERGNEAPKISRVGNQRQVRTPPDGQEGQGQCKYVIKRKRCNAIGLADIPYALQRRGEPGLSLQNCGNDIAVGQDGALAQPGGATGILQECHRVQRGAGCLKFEIRTCCHHLLEGGY